MVYNTFLDPPLEIYHLPDLIICVSAVVHHVKWYIYGYFFTHFFFEDNKNDTKEREKYVFANTIIGFPRNHGNFKAKIKIRLNNKL